MTAPVLPATGNTSHTQPENRAFYPALDGLRAFAFLMVFFYHYDAMPFGYAGVDIFFVLSGFLITGILWDSRDDRHRARNFYVRRTLRIFPLYYGVMLGILLLQPVAHWRWTWYWLVWPLYIGNLVPYLLHHFALSAPFEVVKAFLIYRQRPSPMAPLILGHFWTLCIEEQFYLVWPWMVFLIPDRRKLIWICAASLPICLGLRMLGLHFLPQWAIDEDALFHITIFRVDDLLLGALLALLLRGPLAASLLRWSRRLLPVAVLTLVAVSLFFPFHRVWVRPYPYPPFGQVITWGLSIIGVLTGIIVLAIVQPSSILARVLSIRPLRWLGRISYGAYVLHIIPMHGYEAVATHFFPGNVEVATSTLSLSCTILLAWLSFRFLETPFLNLKDRWTLRNDHG